MAIDQIETATLVCPVCRGERLWRYARETAFTSYGVSELLQCTGCELLIAAILTFADGPEVELTWPEPSASYATGFN